MRLVFITNLVHHHQIPLADEFYRLIGDGYTYIATEKLNDMLIRGGYNPNISRPYIIKAYEKDASGVNIKKLVEEADVVIIGSAPESYVEKRIEERKLTFRYSERWFKSKPWFLSGPRAWMNFYKYHIRHRNKPLYMLAASAFTCRDVNAIGAYKDKVFKWGYFTKVDNFEVDSCPKLNINDDESVPQIMWCARFLKLKHPELAVKLADRLKKEGYKFHLNMYGSGDEFDSTKSLASRLGVDDVLSFRGNLPNEELMKQMRKSEIFLFTSDRNEGWGAVLNESMSNGCAVVASHLIGSVPFLIEDGENGLVFKSGNLDSLVEKVSYLLDNQEERIRIAKSAIATMREIWSPKNAASRFIRLVQAINDRRFEELPKIGPCSKA